MRPGMTDQLAGIRRILEDIVAPELRPGYPTQMLRGVVKNLAMLEKAWDQVLPFLRWDTEATTALLDEAAPYVDEDLRSRIVAAGAQPDGDASASALEERHSELRGLLSEALPRLMAQEGTAHVQDRIKAHLVERMDRYPFRMAIAAPTKKK